jgi:hypothetical protein
MQRPAHPATPASFDQDVPIHSPDTIDLSSDSETEPEEDNRMALNRFAYQIPSRTQSVASLSRASSIPIIDKPAIAKNKPSRSAGQHRFMADFPDAELARLVKCVCCGIGWTTRKGVAQKMIHVQSCAKKNALTDDTVKILIRQEVDKALTESRAAKANDPENVLTLPEAPKTYLDELVQGVEPKKRGRHLEIKTVKNGIETREIILERARVILGNHAHPNAQEDGGRQFQSQEFRPSRLADQFAEDTLGWSEAPATQAFGESALRRRQAPGDMFGSAVRKRTMFDTEPVSDEVAGLPPSTQNFAPSKLAGLHRTSSNSAFNLQYEVDFDASHRPQPVLSPGLVRTLLTITRRARLITYRHPLHQLLILSAQVQEVRLPVLSRGAAHTTIASKYSLPRLLIEHRHCFHHRPCRPRINQIPAKAAAISTMYMNKVSYSIRMTWHGAMTTHSFISIRI